jgi:hypothetical protein
MPEVIKAAACGSIIKKPRSLTPPQITRVIKLKKKPFKKCKPYLL